MLLTTISDKLALIAAITTATTVIWLACRKVRSHWRHIARKLNQAFDSVVGSEAILDPETGKVLRPERLSIGARMAVVEEWQAQTIPILENISTALAGQATLDRRFTELLGEFHRHEQIHNRRYEQLLERLVHHERQAIEAGHCGSPDDPTD